MVATATTNTKELREKAGQKHKDALAKMEEHRDENGQVPADILAQCKEMTAESANLIAQAELIESGNDQSLEDQVKSGRFNLDPGELDERKSMSFWKRPVMVRSGLNNNMIDINPLNGPTDDRWAGVAKEGNDDLFWSDTYHRNWLHYVTEKDMKKHSMPEMLVRKEAATANGSFSTICAPIRFSAQVLSYCKDLLWFRQFANILTVRESCSLGIIKEVRTETSAAWGAVCKEPEKCEIPGFRLKTLEPQWMSYCATICRALLNQRCEIDVEAMIAMKLARDSSELEEHAFFWGDGKEKPLGLFYDPASKDDHCGAEPQFDYSAECPDLTCGLDWTYFVQAYCALPQCTRNNPQSLGWIFHQNIICALMLLADGNGRPLWMNSLQAGQPSQFLNLPVRESSYAPSTLEAGKFFGALADLSGYTIADGLDQLTERDDDIKKNQACWVGRRAVDGMVTEPEKIVRLKFDEAVVE